MEKLSIGQMSKLNNISIQALRLYDELGILTPIEINEQTGYRYYDIKQSAKLDMINYMKATGMSLKDIKGVFDNNDLSKLTITLEKHLDTLDNQINDLKQQKKAIKKMIDSYNRYLNSPTDGMITLEYIPERKYYPYKSSINIYDYDLSMYENLLKNLKDDMLASNIPEIYYYNAGTTILEEDFKNDNIKSDEIFVFVDNELHDSNLKSIPTSEFVCIYCDAFDKEIAYIHRLKDYIKAHNFIINGHYICEVLCELPFLTSNKREMYLRLQVPVAFKKNI